MKHILALIALTLVSLSLSARTSVDWLETRHNFGAFDEDLGPVSAVFKFVNNGDEAVSILAARASCGCTVPKYSRDPIAPGDTAYISVTYDPAGRPGRFTKYVGVEISGDVPKVKLYVSGTVVGNQRSIEGRFPVKVDKKMSLARGAVMFGPINKGSLRTYNLQGYNHSTDTIYPEIANLPGYIKVDVVPKAVPAGEQMTFILYFNTAKTPLYGLVDNTLQVKSGASASGFDLPVTALIEEDFTKMTPKQLDKAAIAELSESSIDFGRIKGQKTLSGEVEITNKGKSELIIRRVYSSDHGVSVSVSKDKLKPGKSAVIKVTVDTGEIPGDILNARVAVICNDPANPTLIIRLVGE